MLLTHKLRLTVSRYSYLETALILTAFMVIGYLFEPEDPLLIHYEMMYLVLVMMIITLFHGIGNGLVAVLITVSVLQLFYQEFPVREFLYLFILVLVLGEFHYFWNRKIIQNSSKNTYLRIKLDELTNAFYTLKISHDQLEKNYVFKPMSLRNSIRMLKEAYVKEGDYYKEFLTLLHKSFNVSEAELCLVHKDRLYDVYDEKRTDPIGKGDPMVEAAFVKKSPMYVSSQEVQNNSEYLAVIPAVSYDRVKGMLLIKKMPFLSFNKDTLITISVLIAYFIDELEKWHSIKSAKDSPVDESFAFELKRVHKLYVKYDVESTILVIKSKDELLSHLIVEMVEKNLRSLDMFSTHKASGCEVLAILFPFADEASARGFLQRLFKLMKIEEEDERLEFSLFDISELEIAKRYAEIENNAI